MAPRYNESSSDVICDETPVNIHTTGNINNDDSEPYPFTWTDLSDEEKKERKRIYTAEGPWCVSPKASMLVIKHSWKKVVAFYNTKNICPILQTIQLFSLEIKKVILFHVIKI